MKNKCNIPTATRKQIPASCVQAWRTLYHPEWQEAKCSVEDCWQGTSPSCSQLCAFGQISCCHQEALGCSVCCLNLSTAVQSPVNPVWMVFYCYIFYFYWLLGNQAFSGRIWQSSVLTKERQRKAWKVEGAMVKWAPVGGTGWLLDWSNLALPLIYHLALVTSLNHGLFIHLKNEHSLHLPHKDVVRAEVWNGH